MSFTTAQQWQFFRVPTADSSLDTADKYALVGLVQALSPDLDSTLKKQLLRYPVADASFDTSDKFALAGYPESFNTGNAIIDIFEVSWTIDPTWTTTTTPAFDGTFAQTIGSFGARFIAARLTSNVTDIAARTITVADEADKTILVAADPLTVTVSAESNTMTVSADKSTLQIAANDEVTIV